MMRYFQYFFITFFLICPFINPQNSFSANDNPQEVIAIVLRDWPPQFLTDQKTGKPTGFAIDIINKVAELSGLKVQYITYDDWPDALEGFKKHRIALLPNMGITAERQETYDFTTPYETFRISLFVRESSSDINELSDFIEKKVGAVATNQGLALIQNKGIVNIQTYKSPEELFMALLSGAVDVAVYPEQVFQAISIRAGLEKKIKIIGDPLQEIKRGIAVRKGETELIQKLDHAVQLLIGMPEYKKIYQDWYGIPGPFWNIKRVSIAMLCFLGLSIAAILAWRYVTVFKLNKTLSRNIQELKETQESLNTALLWKNTAVKAAKVGLWDWDLITNQVRYSAEWKKQIGYEDHEIGNNFEEWKSRVHPDDIVSTIEKVQNAITQLSQDHSVEFRFRHKDGQYLSILAQSSVIPDEAGQPIKMIGSHVDISEIKKLEIELGESEDKYRHLFETMTQGAIIQDADGRVIEANQAACELMGLEMDEMVASTVYDPRWKTIHRDGTPFDPNDLPSSIALRTGKPKKNVSCGIYIPEKDAYHWNLASSVPRFKDGDTKPLSTITVFTDITELYLAEQNLIESEKRYRALFENITAGFALFEVVEDDNGAPVDLVIVAANKGFGVTTGLKIQDITGKRFSRVLPGIENDSADWIGTLGNIGLTGTPQHFEQGSELLGCYYSIVAYQAGPKQCAATFVDITERKSLESKLQQAQKLESIGTLAGGIAHDFNNILASIIGFTELATEDAETGSVQEENLEEVYKAGKRAKQLVQQILAFASKSTEEKDLVRLSDIVTEALKLLRPSTPSSIDIISAINSTSWIMGNESQLHQIVMNLCTNAIYALQESGRVLEIELRDTFIDKGYGQELSSLPAGEYVEFIVADDGPGIEPAIIEKIFEPYFTTKAFGEGTGMGLAMVKGIVESHGGAIQVTSKPGKKTVFTIRLPSAKSRQEETIEKIEPLSSGTERILFVDDEPSLTRLGSLMLKGLGYRVTELTSSVEALRLFKENPDAFDLVITDMTMPSMTGDVLSNEMRKLKPDLPIILCTGYSSKLNNQGVRYSGINALVNKPLTKSDIARTIREVLDSRG